VSSSGAVPLARTSVSIIIPTLNGGEAFARNLKAMKDQEGVGPLELIVLDSQSRDGTAAAAARAGARVMEVERAAFNHGRVRHRGAISATGDVLVFTVQDARPADRAWLRELIAPLKEGAGAASSRILPRPEAHLLAQRTVLDSPMASPEPRRAASPPEEFRALSPARKRRFACFDDISSAVDAAVYEKVPFRPVPMAEDLQWALDALEQGVAIAFAPRSVILHSHEYSLAALYARYRDDARAMRRVLGLRTRRNFLHFLKGWAYEVSRDFAFLRRKGLLAWSRYAASSIMMRGVQTAAQWRGSR